MTLPSRPELCKLSELPPRVAAVVVDVGSEPVGIRLMELGLYPGVHLVVLQSGETTLLAINTSRVAISRHSLSSILVSKVEKRPQDRMG